MSERLFTERHMKVRKLVTQIQSEFEEFDEPEFDVELGGHRLTPASRSVRETTHRMCCVDIGGERVAECLVAMNDAVTALEEAVRDARPRHRVTRALRMRGWAEQRVEDIRTMYDELLVEWLGLH